MLIRSGRSCPISIDVGVIGRYMEDLVRMPFLRQYPSDLGVSAYKFDNEIIREEINSLLANEQRRKIQSLALIAS